MEQVVLALDAGNSWGWTVEPLDAFALWMPARYHDDSSSHQRHRRHPAPTGLIQSSDPYGYATRAGGVEVSILQMNKRVCISIACLLPTQPRQPIACLEDAGSRR